MSKTSEHRKVMLITGTSRGIGRFLAEYYIKQGFDVIGCSRSGSDIKSKSYKHFETDISVEKNIQQIFSHIRKEYKKLDVLINNAAINPMIVPASFLPYDVIEKTYKVNVFATMLFCREAVKIMSRNKFGRIINIGSIATRHDVKGESLYTSTKAAVNTFTRVLAKEVYTSGITANVLAPSVVKTEMSEKIKEEAIQQIFSRNAIDEFGKMEDISAMIDFLIKEDSSACTGQIYYLGGA